MIKFLTRLLLFFFICFLIPEIGLRFVVPKISHHQNIEKAVRLLPQVDENTILFVGDSRVEWGIKPSTIEQETGQPTLNLAMPGSNGLDVMTYLKKNKVYPKKIIVGVNYFSPTWRNFKKTEKLNTSWWNRLSLSANYLLKQHSYLYEKKSLEQYAEGEQPFFLHHNYDKKGSVTVKERGNYEERKAFQLTWFKSRAEKMNIDSIANIYSNKMAKEVSHFQQKGTDVIGLVMPICNDLHKIEGFEKVDSLAHTIPFNRIDNYMDTHRMKLNETAFQDCSHLTPAAAEIFSKTIANELVK